MGDATSLRISDDLTLPLDVVSEATAIVATRGAGKSSGSAVFVEEAFRLDVQAVVLDRTGVYHGLRSNRRGDGPGLGIYVLGGPHGDAPLEPNAGVLIADLIVDTGHSFVLDLSDFSKGAAIRFAADLLERLYDRKARNRSTLLLVIDEAHFYAPQAPRGGFKGDSARLMGAMEDVVGLGRSRGLGVVLTTQRTQALNKAILDLIETLLVMRMLSPRARAAVRDWIQEKHEDDDAGVIVSLDSLPTGTAWVWAPLRGILVRARIRRIKTFDSYATPKPGETRTEPSARAELDLAALGAQIAATAERAKENDPTELRRRLAAAERLVREQAEAIAALEAEEREVVAAFPFARAARASADEIKEAAARARAALADVEARVGEFSLAAEAAGQEPEPRVRPAAPRPAPREARPKAPRRDVSEAVELSTAARGILETVASHYPLVLTAGQVALLSGRKPRGGSWNTAIRQLRDAGLIDDSGPGLIEVTEQGMCAAGGPFDAASGPDRWRGALPTAARDVFDALVAADGQPVDVEALASALGRKPVGGSWNTAVATLVRNGLAVRVGSELAATPEAVR